VGHSGHQAQWVTPVILVTWEAETEEQWFKANWGQKKKKKLLRPWLKEQAWDSSKV
jgi:hypothetical protein